LSEASPLALLVLIGRCSAQMYTKSTRLGNSAQVSFPRVVPAHKPRYLSMRRRAPSAAVLQTFLKRPPRPSYDV
jgi:hypothetical protein